MIRLINILFFLPLFSHAQFSMMANVGQYTAETAPKFGVLVNSSTLSNSEKADIANDSLGCNWNRGAITIDTWSGSSARYEAYDAKGMLQLVVINFATGGDVPFPVAAELSGYASTLTEILDTYPNIYAIVIENEAINENFHDGPFSDYVAEVQTAYPIAHSRGIKVIESGIYGAGLYINTYRYLKAKTGYGQTVADAYGAAVMTTAQINAAETINSNPTLEAKVKEIDTILSLAPYIDLFNLHAYEPDERDDSATQSINTNIRTNYLRYTKEYIEETTHRPCITNETCLRNNDQTSLITNQISELYRLGFWHVQWFDGDDGTAGSVAITNDITGALKATGIIFRDYILSHQGNIYFPLP